MKLLSRHNRFLCLIVLMISLFGCEKPPLEPIPRGGTILAFGDSLTAGVGVSKEKSYPSVLAQLTGLTVVNAGVSGETAGEGLRRLDGVLDEVAPDLLILLEGGNDILRNHSFSDVKDSLSAMIETAHRRNIPVVFIGVPEKSLFSSSAPFYRELAEKYQLVFDGELVSDLQRTPSLKSDHVHFNEAGYRKMAESIDGLLKDSGALR